jgi:hypothetical protein
VQKRVVRYLLHLQGGGTDHLSRIPECKVGGGLTVGQLLFLLCMYVCMYGRMDSMDGWLCWLTVMKLAVVWHVCMYVCMTRSIIASGVHAHIYYVRDCTHESKCIRTCTHTHTNIRKYRGWDQKQLVVDVLGVDCMHP